MEGKAKGLGIGVVLVVVAGLWLLSKKKPAEAALRVDVPPELVGEPMPTLPIAVVPEAAIKQTIASIGVAVSGEATEADIATAAYQTEVIRSSDYGDSYETALAAAATTGVTLLAPAEGGVITVLVGSHDLAKPLPTVVQVSVTPEQAEDYNYYISLGKTPFAASILAGIT